MKELNLTKEKNMYYFTTESGRVTYGLDVNSGKAYKNGKEIEGFPKYFGNTDTKYYYRSRTNGYENQAHWFVGDAFRYYFRHRYTLKEIQIIDRLNSIVHNLEGQWDIVLGDCSLEYIEWIDKNLKMIGQVLKETPPDAFDITSLYGKVFDKEWKALCPNVCADDITNPTYLKLRMLYKLDKKEIISLFDYYWVRGAKEYYGRKHMRDFLDKVELYCSYCECCNLPIKKGNFFREYAVAAKTYETSRTMTLDEMRMKRMLQSSKYLTYENDDFIALVPASVEDFKDEAKQQRNCVYNLYMEKVLDNRCYVTFIRRKNDLKKSYITCEIDLRGQIVQYLGKYNAYIRGEKELRFKKEYQEYLLATLGE